MLNISSPTLLLDEVKCRRNISKMCKKAKQASVCFRPHFKTHQSIEIGSWFRAEGVHKITVSSLRMAHYFAEASWGNILIAFPVNPLETDGYEKLAEKCRLSTIVDQVESIRILAEQTASPIDCYLDIDTGYKRTGITWNDHETIGSYLKLIEKSKNLRFAGFYCHPGNTYNHIDEKDKLQIYAYTLDALAKLKNQYADFEPEILAGDTPGCSLLDTFGIVDTITPGNFVFYDLFQTSIGSCKESEIAVALACPVVGVYPHRNQMVIHGGSTHFSKERINVGNQNAFGKLVKLENDFWRSMEVDLYLTSISQEHGIIDLGEHNSGNFKVGDIVSILPVHSCLTTNLMRQYLTLDGRLIQRFNWFSNSC
ncbi:MAG: alanine racemase [Opitutales bacterium]|nr:alanine racemase [Opitutales bacterium]